MEREVLGWVVVVDGLSKEQEAMVSSVHARLSAALDAAEAYASKNPELCVTEVQRNGIIACTGMYQAWVLPVVVP